MDQILITQKDLSAILDLPQDQVSNFMKKGLPAIKGNNQKELRYDLIASVKWYINYLRDSESVSARLKESQIRRTDAETEKVMLEVKQRKGELISIEVVSNQWSQILTAIKTKLLLIPNKLGLIFDSITDSYSLEKFAEQLIREALEELARTQLKEETHEQ